LLVDPPHKSVVQVSPRAPSLAAMQPSGALSTGERQAQHSTGDTGDEDDWDMLVSSSGDLLGQDEEAHREGGALCISGTCWCLETCWGRMRKAIATVVRCE